MFGADRFDSFRITVAASNDAPAWRESDARPRQVWAPGFPTGRELSPQLSDAFVLITNAHVISEAESDRNAGALHPQEAVVTFAAMPGVDATREFGVARVLCVSPRGAPRHGGRGADGSCDAHGPLSGCARSAGRRVASGSESHGHPSGRGLAVIERTARPSKPEAALPTATEGGSSGSPVFNQDWKLIGLHHAGGEAVPRLNGHDGTYAANEGMWIGEASRGRIPQLR